MLRVAWGMALACSLVAGGCSLIFDGSKYEGSGADAGPGDAGVDAAVEDAGIDAGSDAGGADAGGPTPCTTHEDCLLSPLDTDYVCVSDGSGGHVCAEQCDGPTDCQAVGGGPGHNEGNLCFGTGDCGCETGENCEDPLFPSCRRRDQLCEESNCDNNMDCIAIMPGTYCFGGVCQRITCTTAEECTGEGNAACNEPPGGMGPRVCADECASDGECATGFTCSGTPGRCI